MPLEASNDFGAKRYAGSALPSIHDHLFPSANTGIAWLRDRPEVVQAHAEFLRGVMRVDIFGVREGGEIDGRLLAPLRPEVPTLRPATTYLLETVIRTLKMGHPFTQGTADSNEVWLDVTVTSGDRVIGRSGALDPARANEVDPWAHFVNMFLLDKDGHRIDRRNPQDIVTPLYNHQIPPGAGQTAHYLLELPPQLNAPVTVEVKLQYRKFDQAYMDFVARKNEQLGQIIRGHQPGRPYRNDLPIVTLAVDRVTFPVQGVAQTVENPTPEVPLWQRWNDYGIGLFLKGKAELRQAAEAFAEVEKLGRWDGPLNLVRVHDLEGRLQEAVEALQRAATYSHQNDFPRWTWAWLSGSVNRQQGHLEDAIRNLRSALEDSTLATAREVSISVWTSRFATYSGRRFLTWDASEPGRAASTRRSGIGETPSRSSRKPWNPTQRISPPITTFTCCTLKWGTRKGPPSTSNCTAAISRTTTPAGAPNGWHASATRPPITRPRRLSGIRSSARNRGLGWHAGGVTYPNAGRRTVSRTRTSQPVPPAPADVTLQDQTPERDDAVVGVALRWSLVVLAVTAVVAAGAAYRLSRSQEPPPVRQTELAAAQLRERPTVTIPHVRFSDITEQAGIDFVHQNGAYGQKLLPETMGGGCAFFDFDNDQDPDLLLVNSMQWPWDPRGQLQKPATMALYENDGRGNFHDVTAGSGLDFSCYGMGVAVGDYDNDGHRDLFLTAVGANRLLRNQGDGRFHDVTASAGVAGDEEQWSTSCGWLDYDRDGDLDLLVCNYLQWSRHNDVSQNFQLTGGSRAYGRPQNFEGTFPYLYQNNGDGTFTDVTAGAGLQVRNPATGAPMAKSLGVTFADLDQDGWPDIVVANDTVQNMLFRNQGDGTFLEIGALSGVAFDMNGNARGAMGIDAAHFRNNDAVGIAIGNFANEMTALYVAHGAQMHFMDEAISTGLGPNTRLQLTFGIFFLDYDLDGRLDLLAANGHLEEDIHRVQASQTYQQPPQLFWNCGPMEDTELVPVTLEYCGEELLRPMVGRGTSFADIDSDGDQDVLITTVGQQPRLLRNDQQQPHHWLRFQLTGTRCNRDAIGAWVEIRLPARTLRQQVMPTRSYLSQVELPVTFGLGPETHVPHATIYWPDGTVEQLDNLQVDRLYQIHQAAGPG